MSGIDSPRSRYCMTFCMLGLALGDGYEHNKPSLSTRVTSSMLKFPMSRGSTVSRIETLPWCSSTQSTNTISVLFLLLPIGLHPQATSRRNTPNANTSVKGVAFPVRIISGARYPMVPTTCVVLATVPWSYNLARPKSPSRPFICLSRSTLLAFISRCMTIFSHSS
ncbi:hypothetical protein CFC21_015615 [Triticum aestivum]|uniref:Secreted protein n=2 Tax=Triticum aestivum TaxID=4565 RepID=A0A9R1DXK5_WHEAT|nr:hypothetical protein CFC21_015615 [Triticum aestivum]